MTRDDWITNQELIVALVRNNKFRKLKTPTSRRQVPLVFNISDTEVDIINKFLSHAEAVHGSDLTAPLFYDDHASKKIMDISIKRRTIDALRNATGNPIINLHHARHAAANRVGIALANWQIENWSGLDEGAGTGRSKISNILLGGSQSTRRKGWCIARFLGHVRTKCWCRSVFDPCADVGLTQRSSPQTLILQQWPMHRAGSAKSRQVGQICIGDNTYVQET